MPKKIVQYKSDVLPSGSSGQATQSLEGAPEAIRPVTTPMDIGAGAAAANMGLANTMQKAAIDYGELQRQIKAHDDEIVANSLFNNYDQELRVTLESVKKLKRGTDAIDPTLIPEVVATEKENIAAILEDSKLDKYGKAALEKMLQHKLTTGVTGLYEYQDGQRRVIENTNIQADYEQRESAVKAGADPIQQAALHAEMIKINQPGNEGLVLLHAERLKQAGAQAQKEAAITNAIVDVKERYQDPTYESAYGKGVIGAIKEVESAEFIKVHGEAQQRVILSSLTNEYRRQEEEYRNYADETMGSLLTKIGNGGVTYKDIEDSGLRPSDRAKVMVWQRNEDREARRELMAMRSENRQAASEYNRARKEKSDEIAGSIYGQIITGKVQTAADVYGLVEKGLSPAAARGLVGDLQKIQKDPATKDAYKMIDDFAKISSKDQASKDALVGKLNVELRTAIATEGLQGQKIIDRAQQMTAVKKVDRLGAVLDFFSGKKSVAAAPTATTNTPKGYSIGDVVTGRDGGKYKSLGGGKWEKL